MIKFTTDLGIEITMTKEEMEKVATEMINFAVSEKGYNLDELSTEFICQDITGHLNELWKKGFSHEAYTIVDDVLTQIRKEGKQMTNINYALLWIEETEKWHMLNRHVAEIDEEQFKDGFVAYAIQIDDNDIIVSDTWREENEGLPFKEVYSMLEIEDKYYYRPFIESRTREQLLQLVYEHGFEGVQEFSDDELKDILVSVKY